MNSSFFSINLKDLGKGIIIAVITAFVTALYQQISAGNVIPTADQLRADAVVALGAAISYLLKNLVTNSEGKFLTKD
jgi:hypothetical protein